jgi:outer membrane immunogenic protein
MRLLATVSLCLLSAGATLAADLPSHKAPPVVEPPAFTWQGGYIGLYAGALLADGRLRYVVEAPERGAAFVGGGTLGYNWQWSPTVVLGAEADFGFRGQIASETVAGLYPGPTDSGILGTFRGRAGYAFAPRWLAYGTGGFAFGTNFVPRSFTSSFLGVAGRDSSGTTVRAGWTAGGGVEYAFSDRISFKAEYLYVWLADSDVGYATKFGADSATVRSSGHIVRGGVNYRFGASK